ncbi:MAG: hypothetical protein E7466_00930 [Ruminococcaceae bacterium]|nr:hypothetical protein [Oscillospiraceae bacterium]
MNERPELIVMLTHHDHTVANACEIFEQCKDSRATFWGFKEEGLPAEQMQGLFAYMKRCGKTTVLEVVAYDEPACLAGAKTAANCNCDILMGTLFYDSVNDFCRKNGIKYMPFVGKVSGRPSILEGTPEEMVAQAKEYLAKGAFGIDLLAYRYTGDADDLIRQFLAQVDAPVCIAGSIDCYPRLDAIRAANPWAFTIGGAFFEDRFHGSFAQQINRVCEYLSPLSV